MTHEQFIHQVRDTVLRLRALEDGQRKLLSSVKLTYGIGELGLRGVTYFKAWAKGEPEPVDFVTVCANGEESVIQLVGTTIHELGHSLAGVGQGHGQAWKEACGKLGLRQAYAAGQAYTPGHFDEMLWVEIQTVAKPQDGNPAFSQVGSGLPFVGMPTGLFRPCPLGIGARGGKSRGKGSGSRMRLYACLCDPPVKVRCASDDLDATCNKCKTAFQRQRPKEPTIPAKPVEPLEPVILPTPLEPAGQA